MAVPRPTAPDLPSTSGTAPPGQRPLPLVLASSSPYRRALLERLGIPFTVRSPDVDERPHDGETPHALACRLALAKARAVQAALPHPAVVIGSDQVATIDGRTPVGKPGTFERACAQLGAASGRALQFHTAWCVLTPTSCLEGCATVDVQFRVLSRAEIETYLRIETPYDCAGSAKCEGLGISLLESIRSDDPTALIGLPLMAVSTALRTVGIDPLAPLATGRTGHEGISHGSRVPGSEQP